MAIPLRHLHGHRAASAPRNRSAALLLVAWLVVASPSALNAQTPTPYPVPTPPDGTPAWYITPDNGLYLEQINAAQGQQTRLLALIAGFLCFCWLTTVLRP